MTGQVERHGLGHDRWGQQRPRRRSHPGSVLQTPNPDTSAQPVANFSDRPACQACRFIIHGADVPPVSVGLGSALLLLGQATWSGMLHSGSESHVADTQLDVLREHCSQLTRIALSTVGLGVWVSST